MKTTNYIVGLLFMVLICHAHYCDSYSRPRTTYALNCSSTVINNYRIDSDECIIIFELNSQPTIQEFNEAINRNYNDLITRKLIQVWCPYVYSREH